MPGKTQIAHSIVELRAATGLNQAAFAKRFGVSGTSIGHYEAGSRRPDPGALVKLARAALAARRHDLAEVFAGGIPEVRVACWLIKGKKEQGSNLWRG